MEDDFVSRQQERERQRAESGAGASTPPSFKITVKGYSPTPDTPEKLANTLIKWLQRNAFREDRPYKIVVPENPLLNIAPVRETVESSSPKPSNKPSMGMGMGMGMMGPGAAAGSKNNNAPKQAAGLQVADLMPTRPLANELRDKDWAFTITWDVHMLPPDAVRETEQAAQEAQPKTSSSPFGPIAN